MVLVVAEARKVWLAEQSRKEWSAEEMENKERRMCYIVRLGHVEILESLSIVLQSVCGIVSDCSNCVVSHA
jgi:hypothetical protein